MKNKDLESSRISKRINLGKKKEWKIFKKRFRVEIIKF